MSLSLPFELILVTNNLIAMYNNSDKNDTEAKESFSLHHY